MQDYFKNVAAWIFKTIFSRIRERRIELIPGVLLLVFSPTNLNQMAPLGPQI